MATILIVDQCERGRNFLVTIALLTHEPTPRAFADKLPKGALLEVKRHPVAT